MMWLADVHAALRLWRRRPMQPTLAVAFLACGMGAATGTFAVANAVLWRGLPFPEPSRLVRIQSADRGQPGDTAPGLVQTWIERSRTLDTLGALRPVQATWRDRAGTDRLEGAQVTAGVITALRLTTTRGRLLTADDERAGAAPVVLLTHRLWQSRFGADADIIGRSVQVDGRDRSVVGVLSSAADQLPLGGDWFVPLSLPPAPSGTGPRYLEVIARLAPGSELPATEQELTTLARSVGAVGEDGSPLVARVQPLARAFSADAARVLEPLLIGALLVLLIAAVNTANLRLADQVDRRGELAVRAALGASRGRIIRQLLAEALLISLASGVLGLVLAVWCMAGLQRLLPDNAVRGVQVHVDTRVAVFMLLLVGGVTVLSGVIPALRHVGGSLARGVMTSGRGIIHGDDRLRRAFVVAQIALAMTLGAAGMLMVQTTRSLAEAARDARSPRVWTAAIRLSQSDFPGAADITTVTGRIIERIAALPGTERVAMASRVPFAGGAPGSEVALIGEAFTPGTDRQTRIRFVTPGYFDAVGTHLREGRDVTPDDGAGREPVVLVNEALAARLTPGRSPIGEFVQFAVRDFNGERPTAWRVVGLVADTRDRGPRQAVEPEIYVSLAQGPAGAFDWIGRQLLLVVQGSPTAVISPTVLRTAVNAADGRVPAFDVQTLEQRFATHVSTERLLAGLFVPLALIGVMLASFGVFAVVMHSVQRRGREIALRMVLGAAPADVMRETGRSGLTMASSGIVAGLVGAAGAGRLLQSVSFGVGALEAVTLVPIVLLIGAATLGAVWIPARRAARYDPAVVLRAE
jgi:predicted permease